MSAFVCGLDVHERARMQMVGFEPCHMVFSGRSDQEAESRKEEIIEKDTMEVIKLDKKRLTCSEIISGMPNAFNSEAAGDLAAIIYYKVMGEEPGDYYLEIADGSCTFHEGTPSSPTLTIETPSEVWVAISLGELNARKAFILQKYKTSGDLSLLMKLNSLFSTERPRKKNYMKRLISFIS